MSTLSELSENALQKPTINPITAYSHPMLAADAANAGFKGVLSKPVDQPEFYKLVRQVLTND